MVKLNTSKAKKTSAMLGMLDTIPKGQQSNWNNNLIPHYIKRLKEWRGIDQLEGDIKRNYQYANLLINGKVFKNLAWLERPPDGRRRCPFPQDFAEALEWILARGDEVPENKALMTNFMFINKNFEKIMKKQICKK